MSSKEIAALVNIMSFLTGATLYAMLLVMVLRTPHAARSAGSRPSRYWTPVSSDYLTLATAILGLLWNLGAIVTFGVGNLWVAEPFPILIAAAFTSLGFLPAVVVDSVLRTGSSLSEHKGALLVTAATYLISSIAAGLHFYEAFTTQAVPSRTALLLLTISFGILIILLSLMTRRQPGRSRALWIVALAVFAVSALHLRHHEGDQYSWWIELIGHQASLPLAFAILYQDYRFAFADLFLKRALTLIALVALAFSMYVAVVLPFLSGSDGHVESDPRAVGVILGMWIVTALLYPRLHHAVAWVVDKIVLRRSDYNYVRAEVTRLAASHEQDNLILDDVCKFLGSALTAREVLWFGPNNDTSVASELGESTRIDLSALKSGTNATADSPVLRDPRGLNAILVIPTAEPPRYVIKIGELSGGRRILSDDTIMLEAVAFTIARRIDALRIMHERCEQNLREQQISKLATEAELRALRAQVNPHFLFNALTTIGFLIQTAPERALDTLMRLTGLLRGVLRSADEFTTLGEELKIIESYLEIERARFEDRLRVTIDVPPQLLSTQAPPLLIQPLVENSIKHGISPLKGGGDVIISAVLEPAPESKSQPQILCISVRDNGAGVSEIELAQGRKRGVGINNVEQRLRSYYGLAASLTIKSACGVGTLVEVRLPVTANSLCEMNVSQATNERRRI